MNYDEWYVKSSYLRTSHCLSWEHAWFHKKVQLLSSQFLWQIICGAFLILVSCLFINNIVFFLFYLSGMFLELKGDDLELYFPNISQFWWWRLNLAVSELSEARWKSVAIPQSDRRPWITKSLLPRSPLFRNTTWRNHCFQMWDFTVEKVWVTKTVKFHQHHPIVGK